MIRNYHRLAARAGEWDKVPAEFHAELKSQMAPIKPEPAKEQKKEVKEEKEDKE